MEKDNTPIENKPENPTAPPAPDLSWFTDRATFGGDVSQADLSWFTDRATFGTMKEGNS